SFVLLRLPRSTLFPYTTLFRSRRLRRLRIVGGDDEDAVGSRGGRAPGEVDGVGGDVVAGAGDDLRPVADHAAHDVEQFDLLAIRSEEHTSELQSRFDLVCRLLL